MNLYTKLFLTTGIPYGIMMGVFVALQRGVVRGIIEGLFYGLFFGFFMSLLFVKLNSSKTKKLHGVLEVSPKQSQIITLNQKFDRETAFLKCVDALSQFGAKINLEDKSKFEIFAVSKVSWSSFGEKLTIRLKNAEKDRIEIEISSVPKVCTTIIDYGKGKQNVEKLAALILS